MQVIVFIWFLLGPAIQTVVLALLVRRRFYRRGMFPLFFTYTLYSIVVTILRLVLVRRPTLYANFYWSTEVIYGVLAILSLNEVFSRRFRLDYEEHPWLRFALPVTVAVIIAGLFVWWRVVPQAPGGGHFSVVSSALFAFNFGVHSVEGALLGLFLLLRWLLVPGWNRYDYGILVGFGISAAVTMAARVARFYASSGYETWYRYAPGISYIVASLIWLHAFWPEPDPKPQSLVRFRAMLEQAKHDNELIKLIHDWLNRQR